jgi:hypothetical protein
VERVIHVPPQSFNVTLGNCLHAEGGRCSPNSLNRAQATLVRLEKRAGPVRFDGQHGRLGR